MTMPGGLNASATAVLRFDASAVRPGVMQANGALQELYGTVKDNWWGFQNLGQAITGFGAIIAGGLGAATAVAVDFESQTMRIFKNLSDSSTITAQDMSRIREGLLDIASTSPKSLDEILAFANQSALFGTASDQIVDFTRSVVDLSVGTNLTANDIENLVKVMNEFRLPFEDVEALGSALFAAEKATAGTVGQILTLTKYYGSVFEAIGATADQAIALSATFVGLGNNAQSAATAMQNTFFMIGKAADENIPLFNNFAKVAGILPDQFRLMIENNPVEALLALAGGLSEVERNSVAISGVMNMLDIDNQRQISALTNLASGYAEIEGGQRGLQNMLKATRDAMSDTSAYQAEVERQSSTTAAQVQILQNNFQILANGIGSEVLPAFNFVLGVVNDLIIGFGELPDPVQGAIAAFGGVSATALLFGGALLLIVPRLSQAAQAVSSLRGALIAYGATQQAAAALVQAQMGQEAAQELLRVKFGQSRRARVAAVLAEEAALQASMGRTMAIETAAIGMETTKAIATEAAAAAEAAYAAVISLRAQIQAAAVAGDSARVAALTAQLPALTAASAAAGAHALATAADAQAALGAAIALDIETAAVVTSGAAQATATPIAIAFGAALDFMLGPIGLIIIGLTALVAVLGVAMWQMGRNTRETDKYKDANKELSKQLAETGADVVELTNKFLLAEDGMLQVIDTAERLGITVSELFSYIRGTSDAATSAKVFNTLNEAIAAGEPGANEVGEAINKYSEILQATKRHAESLAGANKELGVESEGATAATLGLEDAVGRGGDAAETAANAVLGLLNAQRSLTQATRAVEDAERDLEEARSALSLRSETIARLEDAVTTARMAETDATDRLALAEENLKRARSEAARQLNMDKLNLAKARAQEVLDTIKLKEAQEALNEAQSDSDVDMASKADRIADARRLLAQATKEAADAEYDLMYLKSQGASAADIATATRRVQEAKGNQSDAQVNFDDVSAEADSNTGSSAEEEAAQRVYDVASAAAALASTQATVAELTEKVNEGMADAARDKAYKNALEEVTEAQLDVRRAAQGTRDATRELDRELSDNPGMRAYQDAQEQLEDALFRQAQAIVDVKRYTFELGGQSFTTAQEIDAMREALGLVAADVEGPVRSAVQGYIGDIATLEGRITGMDTKVPDLVPGSNAPVIASLDEIGTKNDEIATEGTGRWSRFSSDFGDIFDQLGEDFQESWDRNWDRLDEIFGEHWDDITEDFRDGWDRAMEYLPKELTGAFRGIGKALGGAFEAGFKESMRTIEGAINVITTAINETVIDAANSLLGFLPDISVLGGHEISKIPPVKFHAAGGVYGSAHMGVIGEAGPEAIMPLERLESMFEPISSLTTAMIAQQQAMSALLADARTSALIGATAGGTVNKYYYLTANNPVPERLTETAPRMLRSIDFVGA